MLIYKVTYKQTARLMERSHRRLCTFATSAVLQTCCLPIPFRTLLKFLCCMLESHGMKGPKSKPERLQVGIQCLSKLFDDFTDIGIPKAILLNFLFSRMKRKFQDILRQLLWLLIYRRRYSETIHRVIFQERTMNWLINQ